VQSQFKKDGFSVTQYGGDGADGIDLVVTVRGSKDVVQCKRWKADVGPAVVREFYGAMIHAGARHGFIVTTARFTAAASSWVKNKPITLIDGQKLLSWLRDDFDSAKAASTYTFNPYVELEIPQNATEAQIKAAYREMMTKYHPDRAAHLAPEIQELAKRKAQAINRAHDMLKPARRLK
jgi:hypothetical protein